MSGPEKKLRLIPVRRGWTEVLATEVAALIRAYAGTRKGLDYRAPGAAIQVLRLVQGAVDKLSEGERLTCDWSHVSTQDRDVLNLSQAWARELERHLRELGKTFEQGKGDLTPGEVRLYRAVLRRREAEAREAEGGLPRDDSRLQAGCDSFAEEVLGEKPARRPKAGS